ncbi:hypothetical protein ACFL6C_08500 [Myxococcota bacterium]
MTDQNSSKTGVTMTLKVDSTEVEIGSFVQNILSSGILGMIRALKGVDNPREVEISIRVD